MIYQKLLEFQKQGITLEKDGTNPHFRSQYVTLNEVLAKVKGPLNELGVIVVQQPNVLPELGAGITTYLWDTEDGSSIECFVPFIGATDMQKLGGAITYARRYSLITLLGLEDEDDDGNKASAPVVKKTSVPVEPDHAGLESHQDDDDISTLEF